MYKHLFPALSEKKDGKELVYLDSACTYIKNEQTIAGILSYYNNYSCCSGDRGASFLGSKLFSKMQDARANIIRFIGAKKNDYIVFTSGTTDSVNKLFYGLDEEKVKTIIVSDLEHNSVFIPGIEYSKEKGIDFKVFKYRDILDTTILSKKLEEIRGPFLLCITHSSNIIGGNYNIEEISEEVHTAGGYIFVDDAQFLSYNKEDVVKNGIDFLAFSGHKLGGPTGIGCLFIKKKLGNLIKYSNKIGGGTVKSIDLYQPKYKQLPDILEGGVQDFSGIMGLNQCINFIDDIGINVIYKAIIDLVDYFWSKFEQHSLGEHFDIISEDKCAVITLGAKNFNVIDFNSYCNYFLKDHIISFRTGTMCAENYLNNYHDGNKNVLRLSFGIYNDTNDIDIFIKAVLDYIKMT